MENCQKPLNQGIFAVNSYVDKPGVYMGKYCVFWFSTLFPLWIPQFCGKFFAAYYKKSGFCIDICRNVSYSLREVLGFFDILLNILDGIDNCRVVAALKYIADVIE